MNYRIGTRGSRLALAQSTLVLRRLASAYPDDTFELVTVVTRGDRVTDRPIAAIGDSALFVREIETALLEHRIDLAVHSMKDLPAECPEGLVLARAWAREDPRDVLVARGGVRSLADLPEGAVVATGSVRRNLLLGRLRPDLRIVDIRGNVDTRLRKLFEPAADEPVLDAIVLAAAGLKRLGRADAITQFLTTDEMLPAANQGQLAIELRADDGELRAGVDALGDASCERVAAAERSFLREMGVDCHLPVGAFARLEGDGIRLRGVFARGERATPVYAEVCAATPEEAARQAAADIRRQISGEVTLVGAGPGDPDLITVKGLAALKAADAVVYDRLVAPELLRHTKPGCICLFGGKESGRPSSSQGEINALLAKLSLTCDRVVRLKGGDPFVFGRGGEEIAYLAERGVRCRTIPGVTSAVAAAEAAGIPVTHRGVASEFDVIAAQGKNGEPADIDYSRLLDPRRTCVFLMGLSQVGEIAAALMTAGRAASDAAAVIASATTPQQKTVVGTLADIAERTKCAGLVSPAVLVVGAVVNLRRRRYLVPVIEGGSATLAERLRALGATVDTVTVGRIIPIEGALTERELEDVDRIVLTSPNGRLALTAELQRAIARRGISVELVREVKPIGRTLHLTQPDADRVPGVRAIDVYRNEPVEIGGLIDLSLYDGVFFTCASSVRRLFAHATGTACFYAIGPKTARALKELSAGEIRMAERPTIDDLVLLSEQP